MTVTGCIAQTDPSTISVFQHFVLQGGWITLFVLIPLSALMTMLIIHFLVTIRRGTLAPNVLSSALLNAARQGHFKKILSTTRQNSTMLGRAAFAGLNHLTTTGRQSARAAIDEAVEERATGLFRRIEYLQVIGNISPMIGLLGTVYGMIHAFSRIFAAGGGMPDAGKLAGDISVAMVTTFWGILIAIPALTAHALFRNRIDAFAAECVSICDELIVLAVTHATQNQNTRGQQSPNSQPTSRPATPAGRNGANQNKAADKPKPAGPPPSGESAAAKPSEQMVEHYGS